jgi:uncharacterized protein YuzE
MRVSYDAEADILLVVLREEAPVDALEEPGGVVLCYGADGEPVSVELLNASKRSMVTSRGVSVTLEHAGRA